MKLDIKRAIISPFKFPDNVNATNTYLIATGVTIASALIFILVFILFYAVIFGSMIGLSELWSNIVIAVISIFSPIIFILPFTVTIGYITETMSLEVQNKDAIMFPWNGNFLTLTCKGLKFIFVFFIYEIIYTAIIMLPIILSGSLVTIFKNMSETMTIFTGTLSGIIIFFVILIATIILTLLIPMMWVTLAATDSMLMALNIVHITKKIINNFFEYILAYIILIAISIIISMIAVVLCMTVVCIILLPLIFGFIIPVMSYNMFAQLYNDA